MEVLAPSITWFGRLAYRDTFTLLIPFVAGKLHTTVDRLTMVDLSADLLHAGVDINTIRAWLGHVSLETTNIYAETNMEMKAKALAMCEIEERKSKRRWREDPGLMAFLRSL